METTEQEKTSSPPNPEGKGGFKEHPENINYGGRPKTKILTGALLQFLEEIDPQTGNPRFVDLAKKLGLMAYKGDIHAMALLYLAAVKKLKIPIVGGSEEKARKIMDYVVAHIADHPLFYQGLINADISKIEQLKVSVSKNGLRWYDGGWIYITSIDARQISKEGESVVGEGGDVVVLEEAGLIKQKDQFSKVVRMPEEDKGWGKLIMSGNCIENSVFETAFNDPLYYKVRIPL